MDDTERILMIEEYEIDPYDQWMEEQLLNESDDKTS